jgi:hypothetical protein
VGRPPPQAQCRAAAAPRGPGWHNDRVDGDRADGDPPGWFAGHVTATLTGGALGTAGFGHVAMLDSPRPQNCIFVCRP